MNGKAAIKGLVAALCAAAGLCAAAETNRDARVVWYVPGWMRTKAPHGTDWRAFTNAFPEATHVFKGWNGNVLWGDAVENADAHATALADELSALSAAERGNITLVGHSLGARMTARTLAILGRRGVRVGGAVLLAAAIPNDDPDLDEMGLGSNLPVVCLCNPDDVTLKYVYAIGGGEGSCAFGAGGAVKRLVNVVERAVPADIAERTKLDSAWAKVGAFRRVANHHAPFYFAYLKMILDGEADEEERRLIPQDNVNWSLKVIDGEVWWDVLDANDGWKLERHKITGHCRILDPRRRRAAWGDEEKMRAAFRKAAAD